MNIRPTELGGVANRPKPEASQGFRELLDGRVTFSQHAKARMRERQLTLKPEDMRLLAGAMDEAKKSGASKAAVVMPHGIFIVAPDKGTVVTTLEHNQGGAMQVITNVDALVMVGRTSSEEVSSPRPTDGGQPAPVHWSLISSDNQ